MIPPIDWKYLLYSISTQTSVLVSYGSPLFPMGADSNFLEASQVEKTPMGLLLQKMQC